MISKNKMFFIINIILTSSCFGGDTLTLTASLQKNKENNNQYLSSVAFYNAEKNKEPIALAKMLPKVDLSATFSEKRTTSFPDDTLLRTPYDYWQISYSQDIFNTNNLIELQNAKLTTKLAHNYLKKESQSLILDTANNYINLAMLIDQGEVAKKNEQSLEVNYNIIKQSAEAGLSTAEDELAAKAALAYAKTQTFLSQKQIIDQLNQIELSTNSKIDKIKTLGQYHPPKGSAKNISRYLKQAIENNPDISISKIVLETATNNKMKEISSFIPKLRLEAYRKGVRPHANITTGAHLENFVGVNATWNILNGGENIYKSKEKDI